MRFPSSVIRQATIAVLALVMVLLTLALIAGARADTVQEQRWAQAKILPQRVHEVGQIAARILVNRPRYAAVDQKTGVPWYVIAGLHNMESGGSFKCHLHEGSPLVGRTRFVPKGRPPTGKPPFLWEVSAQDALLFDHLDRVEWSRLDPTLTACERYNGTGYIRFHPETPTPYLWAGTSVERPGKYIADGKWSSTAHSDQIGIAAIWRELERRGVLDFHKIP